ncbi:MAG: cytochrome c oxidase subunit II [Gemmatimonadaceae bacterium]
MRKPMLLLLAAAACAPSPSPMLPASEPASHIATLGWWLIAVATLVFLVVVYMLLVPLRARRQRIDHADVEPPHNEGMILIAGALVPAIILVGVYLGTLQTLSATAAPPARPKYMISVIGHQWWWELHYSSADSGARITTANELHIPVGQPVALRVSSNDVAHSFWVPQLQGKIDAIPGQTNTFWIRADKAGTYKGTCAEFCGMQHAHMAMIVVAEPSDKFEEWMRAQEAPAPTPTDSLLTLGRAVFEGAPCVLCHTVRGTSAHGTMGPDLTHIATRLTLGAGVVDNTPPVLAGWIANAQAFKPGSDMPQIQIDGPRMSALVAYLESLR